MGMRHILGALVAAGFGAACVLGSPGPRWAHGAEPRVLVLVSHSAPPYSDALAGFRDYLRQRGIAVTLDVQSLDGDGGKAAAIVQETRRSKPGLVVTLGSLATQAAAQGLGRDTPIVATLVVSADELRKAPNMTGVALEFPIETQLQWLKRFLPAARTVGVLYNPAENQPRIAAATPVAARMGLALEAQPVPSPRDLPLALESLGRRVDVLWSIPDTLVLNAQTAQQVLLFSLRQRLPFVGLSSAWAKAGALYALDWDYVDLGAQSGQLAGQILQGTLPGAIPVTSPRKVSYVINQRTATQMRLELPETLVRGARELF